MLNRIFPFHGLARPLISVCLRPKSTSAAKKSEPKKKEVKKLSHAMQYYIKKRQDQDEFIAHEQAEFDLGKKHLANMMGMDSSAMTQDDIDKAIGD